MSWVSILVALAGGIVPGQIIMTKRPETLTVSLSRADHAAQREALNDLAEALGLRGISGLARWLADTYTAAAAETVALLVAAGGVAAGGDEWDTLLAIRPWLPEITMSTTPNSPADSGNGHRRGE